MADMPLPALHLVTGPNPNLQGVQIPNAIDNYRSLLAIKQAMAEAPIRQQILAQQAQQGQLDLQLGQQNLAARQALNQAYSGAVTKDENGVPTVDDNKLMQGLANSPAAYQTPEVMKGLTDYHKAQTDFRTSLVDLQTKSQDMLGSAAAAVKAAGYDPTLAHHILDTMPQSPQLQAFRSQIDNPVALHQLVDQAIAASPKQRELGAQETTAQARQMTAQTEQQKLTAQMNPQSSLYAPSAASVALGTAPGAAAIQQAEAQQAGRKSAAEAAARQPFEIALNKQRQALSQGDPSAAADLLISGDATLSELKSRGATPDFIAQTLAAAHQKSNGQYNAPQAEAALQIAKSPANTAFFGSANSLTDKGGTLDQLAEAAKAIPQNQWPVLNTLQDWQQAATGSGPIAKYAATALGVADDYAKVMGGGTGSDASRLAALNLIAAKQSPAQRAAAIDGIRGAVASQANSRIGNNPIMKRMYQSTGASGGTNAVTVTAPNGKTYSFPDQASAAAFKQRAGIQ